MKVRNAVKAGLLCLLVLVLGAGCRSTRSASYASGEWALARGGHADHYADAMPRMPARAAMAPMPASALVAGEATLMDSELPEGMLPAEGGIEQAADAGERLMTYQAVLRMVVPDVEAALQSTQAQAAGMGGYMQGMTGRSLTVRVPA